MWIWCRRGGVTGSRDEAEPDRHELKTPWGKWFSEYRLQNTEHGYHMKTQFLSVKVYCILWHNFYKALLSQQLQKCMVCHHDSISCFYSKCWNRFLLCMDNWHVSILQKKFHHVWTDLYVYIIFLLYLCHCINLWSTVIPSCYFFLLYLGSG